MKKTEFAIIGFGKAGKTLAGKFASQGHHVIMIEKDPKMYGGTCINVACIPTKALVEEASLSNKLGGSFEEKAARFTKAMANKDVITGKLRDKNYHKLADNPNIEVLVGEGHFIDDHHVAVGDEVIEAETIIVDTGARPFLPPIPGINSKNIYVSESLLELTKLPKRLTIVGGGYIGLEFASMFLNFGSEVTVIQVEPTFIGREDEEVAAVVEMDFAKRGLKLIKSAKTLSFEEKGGVVTTNIEVEGKPLAIQGEVVLVATGRRPNIDGLDLAKAGVNLTPRGAIAVNEHNQTNVNNIYAAGDVVGGLQFTYISLDDYRVIVSALTGGPRTNANRGNVPYSVFIDPTLSRLGLTEKEAREKGYEVVVARLPANAIPKALILGQTNGLLKVVIDAKSHEILGAHLYCVNSHEMINELKMAMDNHIKYEYLRDAIYTHPTMMEAYNDLFSNVK